MSTVLRVFFIAAVLCSACGPRAEVRTANDLALGGATHLFVKTAAGDVSVWPGPAGTLHADVTRTAYTENAARALALEVRSDGNQAFVEWTGPSWDGRSVSLAITAPPDLTVEIDSDAGDIRVDDHAAPVRVHTAAGNITLSGALSGESFAHTEAGDIAVTIAAGTRLAVTARTEAGVARNDFGMPVDGEEAQQSFSGTIGDGSSGWLDLDTAAGNLALYQGRDHAILMLLLLAACSSATPQATLSVSIGPIPLASGEEKTVCATVRLSNAADIDVVGMSTTLAPGSHHLILYRSTSTVESPSLTPCQTFDTVMQGDVPLLLAGTLQTELKLPSGVAYHLPRGQMVKLEAHYVNATASPIEGRGTVTMALGAGTQAADVMLCGSMRQLTTDGIPPQQRSVQLDPGFYAGGGDVDFSRLKLFGLTSHEHHLGTGVTIGKSRAAADPGTSLFATSSWDNPPLTVFDNVVSFAPGEGLRWQCSYDSLDAQPPPADTTYFGPSALANEMCFIAVNYYPSVGRFIGPPDCAEDQ